MLQPNGKVQTYKHAMNGPGMIIRGESEWNHVRRLIYEELKRSHHPEFVEEPVNGHDTRVYQDICFKQVAAPYIFNIMTHTVKDRKAIYGYDMNVHSTAKWKDQAIMDEMAPDRADDNTHNVLAVALYDKTDPATGAVVQNVGSFLLGEHKEGDVYIDIICAHNTAGKQLLEQFIRSMNEPSVRLSALATVLNFYPKPPFNFKFRKTCAATDHEINVNGTSIHASREFFDTLKFDTMPEDTKASLQALYDAELFATQDPEYADPTCRNLTNFKNFWNHKKGCWSDGVKMSLCNSELLSAPVGSESSTDSSSRNSSGVSVEYSHTEYPQARRRSSSSSDITETRRRNPQGRRRTIRSDSE